MKMLDVKEYIVARIKGMPYSELRLDNLEMHQMGLGDGSDTLFAVLIKKREDGEIVVRFKKDKTKRPILTLSLDSIVNPFDLDRLSYEIDKSVDFMTMYDFVYSVTKKLFPYKIKLRNGRISFNHSVFEEVTHVGYDEAADCAYIQTENEHTNGIKRLLKYGPVSLATMNAIFDAVMLQMSEYESTLADSVVIGRLHHHTYIVIPENTHGLPHFRIVEPMKLKGIGDVITHKLSCPEGLQYSEWSIELNEFFPARCNNKEYANNYEYACAVWNDLHPENKFEPERDKDGNLVIPKFYSL